MIQPHEETMFAGKRVKKMSVSAAFWMLMLRGKEREIHAQVMENALPEDAFIYFALFELDCVQPYCGAIWLYLESKEWPEVAYGEGVPVLPDVVLRRMEDRETVLVPRALLSHIAEALILTAVAEKGVKDTGDPKAVLDRCVEVCTATIEKVSENEAVSTVFNGVMEDWVRQGLVDTGAFEEEEAAANG